MIDITSQLVGFAQKAQRNYKYKEATARALISTTKVFDSVMLEDEKQSLPLIKQKVDELANRIEMKYPDKYSVSSLMTYKSRLLRLIGDFEKYGHDAQAMAAWSPTIVKRGEKNDKSPKDTDLKSEKVETAFVKALKQGVTQVDKPSVSTSLPASEVADLNLPLSGGRTVAIYYPKDITEVEADKIGIVLKSIAGLSRID